MKNKNKGSIPTRVSWFFTVEALFVTKFDFQSCPGLTVVGKLSFGEKLLNKFQREGRGDFFPRHFVLRSINV
jgi:hypothetical protein